jgi:hypothetical protein
LFLLEEVSHPIPQRVTENLSHTFFAILEHLEIFGSTEPISGMSMERRKKKGELDPVP